MAQEHAAALAPCILLSYGPSPTHSCSAKQEPQTKPSIPNNFVFLKKKGPPPPVAALLPYYAIKIQGPPGRATSYLSLEPSFHTNLYKFPILQIPQSFHPTLHTVATQARIQHLTWLVDLLTLLLYFRVNGLLIPSQDTFPSSL